MLVLGLNVLETRAWTQTKVTKLQQWRITRSGKNSKRKPLLLSSFFLSIFFFLIFQVAQTEILQQEITNHLQHLNVSFEREVQQQSSNYWLFCKTSSYGNLQDNCDALRMSFGLRSDPLEQAQFNISRLYLNTQFGLWNKEIWCFSFRVETGFRIEFSFELVWFPLCRWKDGRGWTHKPRG